MSDVAKRTVYSVSEGEYSDYRVLDLFEDKDDAEAIASHNPDWDVQEFNLYPSGTRTVMVPQKRYSARILINGDGRIVDHVSVRDWADYPDEEPSRDMAVTHRAPWPLKLKVGDELVPVPERVGQPYEVTVHADSEERARKVARERAAKVASVLIDGGTPQTPY